MVAVPAGALGPFTLLAQTPSTAYVDNGPARGTRYWYRIRSYDGAGNRSANSATVSAVAT